MSLPEGIEGLRVFRHDQDYSLLAEGSLSLRLIRLWRKGEEVGC